MATQVAANANRETKGTSGVQGAGKGNWKQEVTSWLRYLYFLRFSLLLWIFPLVLIVLDKAMPTFVSGLMVPEYLEGYLCVSFFVVSTAFAALISARIVVFNGEQRWGDKPPKGLHTLLAGSAERWEWIAPAASLLWAVVLMVYMLANHNKEGISGWAILGGWLVGSFAAGVFWWLLNAWYYLAYRPRALTDETGQTTDSVDSSGGGLNRAARTILFPRRMFGLRPAQARGGRLATQRAGQEKTIEDADVLHWFTDPILKAAATILRTPGYRHSTDGALYEGHAFALFATLGFLTLYLLIWPLSAPVPSVRAASAGLAIVFAGVVLGMLEFCSAHSDGHRFRVWKWSLSAGLLGFWAMVLWLYLCSSAERFPILAVVLILVTALAWVLSGLGFLLDRYRIPVLTTFMIGFFILHALPGATDEHYLSTTSPDPGVTARDVPTPAAILDDRLTRLGASEPLIVVTATGGGLHASAWTARVLAKLEDEFASSKGPRFHDRLLMMSTVSGGSEGLNAYLHALEAQKDSGAPQLDTAHMQAVAQCSALEAVGWGLVYYDFPKAFSLFGPFLPVSGGHGDLDTAPRFKDRTWALRKAFERNEGNAYCEDLWTRDAKDEAAGQQAGSPVPGESVWNQLFRGALRRNVADNRQMMERESAFTLTRLLPIAHPEIPAFSMNTTTVELGDRFLASNYVVPRYVLDSGEGNALLPAQSFLDTFKHGDRLADLPLATAVQMSATFPFVSSTARAPVMLSYDGHSVHFADGGNYDNDGTATVLEFLRYALAREDGGSDDAAEKAHLHHIQQMLAQTPLHILWIEIRNSGDFSRTPNPCTGGNGAREESWKMTDELGAPVQVFWNAGHESVTGRNRASLDLLQQTYIHNVSIRRVVIADSDSISVVGTDPLNWSLTPRQRAEVRISSDKLAGVYKQVRTWFDQWPGSLAQPHQGVQQVVNPCPASRAPALNVAQR